MFPHAQVSSRRRFLRAAGALLCATATVAISTACGGSAATVVSTSSAVPATSSLAAPSAITASSTATGTSSADAASTVATTASTGVTTVTVTTTATAVPSTTTATSVTAATSSAVAAPSAARKTLQYWTWWNSSNASFKGWWEFVKPDYEAKHPGQSLDITFVTDDGDYETKLLAAVAGATPPDALHLDIVFAWDTWKHGVLADLSSFSAQTPSVGPDQFFAAAKTYTQDGGHLFGVPTEGPAGYALAYNLDHFKAAGLAAPSPAWTWQDFADAATKLTQRNGDTITRSGWIGAAGSVQYFCDWLYSDGGTFYKPDYSGVAFDDGRGAAVLQLMSDLLNKNRVSATLPKGTSSFQAFLNEQASMITYGMYQIPNTAKQAPLLHYDLMAFPKGPQGKGPATALEYDMEVVPKDAKNVEASWGWITYYAGADVQAQLPAKIGFVSPRKDVYQSAAWKGVLQQYPLLDRVPAIAALPDVQAYPFVAMAQLYKDLPTIFGDALQGKLAISTAITQAADKVKTILAQANA